MKNSKGISLIALIITIIVIIILAAIVIGGVFSTPNDAKFANFCQEYDRVQTAIQLKYYELYQQYAIGSTTQLPTHYAIYRQVADGKLASLSLDDADYDRIGWVKILFDAADRTEKVNINNVETETRDKTKLCDKPNGLTGDWFLRTSDGKLVYAGFEKGEADMYYTPNVHCDAHAEPGKPRATFGLTGTASDDPNRELVLSNTGLTVENISEILPATAPAATTSNP